MNAEQFLQEALEIEKEIIKDRRFLHAHAETGFDLTETLSYVKKRLAQMGYNPVDCGRAGVWVTVGGNSGNRQGDSEKERVFLLRADMDALPVTEEADVEFACQNGCMHACGHDMHTAMLLGAASLLKMHEKELKGTVKLMFQPAEEILEGSADMIDSGVLQAPEVDAAMMIHVMTAVPIPAGTVIVSSPGVSAPAADFFTIRVQGKGCHGSTPQQGIDALTAAAHILIALQEISARELGSGDEAVLAIGSLQAGTAANVIADSAVMQGTCRAFEETVREKIKTRLTEIAQGVAAAFRAEAEVVFDSGCPTLVNDRELSEKVASYTKELLGNSKAFTTQAFSGGKPARNGGSEDFACVSHKVPSVMLALAAGEPEKGYVNPLHHPQTRFDESVLAPGSAVYAWNALRWLETN